MQPWCCRDYNCNGHLMITSIISMWVFRIDAAYLFAESLGMGALGVMARHDW